VCVCVLCVCVGVVQELGWARADANSNLYLLFGKLAELHYLHTEAEKKMAEKVSLL